MKIITRQNKKINKIKGGTMKRMLIVSMVVGLILALTGHAFAMLEQSTIIENNLSPKYQEIKPLL